MSSNLDLLGVVYASDENIAIRATGDFVTLCPNWQLLAYGTDGVIASGDTPWALTSATVDFEAQGIAASQVVQLQADGVFAGSGDLLAVESVAGNTVTLRRMGQPVGTGQPPAPATGIEFTIRTLGPQIEEASFALNRRFGIDAAIPYQTPSQLYDPRDLREATELIVLRDRYVAECRGKDGDFARKIKEIKDQLTEVVDRLQVRWVSLNASGYAEPRTTNLSTNARVSR